MSALTPEDDARFRASHSLVTVGGFREDGVVRGTNAVMALFDVHAADMHVVEAADGTANQVLLVGISYERESGCSLFTASLSHVSSPLVETKGNGSGRDEVHTFQTMISRVSTKQRLFCLALGHVVAAGRNTEAGSLDQ